MDRLAKVMGRELKKEFTVKISGADTEVPRDIYDKVSMAVLQMMKNSMDHGLESKADREQMGKTPVGEISVEISKAAQRVFVAFRDDGRGLNRDQILQKAKEKGLLKKPESEYEDSEIYAFLLRPGFTTKASATLFSGRGVGLDVVNAAVASLGGSIRIESREYMGTTFFMEFPVVDEMHAEGGEKAFFGRGLAYGWRKKSFCKEYRNFGAFDCGWDCNADACHRRHQKRMV